ncbi:hypothetical protein [Sphaerisporangium dianthi]|uniref:Uncharacterized protein n=1 Tax=Sphaerisporangium dianthi TaxID=1436120 RepID=A0ABV9CWI5_9ACTN
MTIRHRGSGPPACGVRGRRQALAEASAQRRPAVVDVVVGKSRFAPVTSFDFWVVRDL